MEDGVDTSEIFVSLSSLLKPEQQPNGEHEEDSNEKREAGEDEGAAEEVEKGKEETGEPTMDNTSKEEEESSSGGAGGIISSLMSNLNISIPGISAGAVESEEDHKKEEEEEEEESKSPGLINHLLPKLPVTMPDEQSPAADEASLLISIIEN